LILDEIHQLSDPSRVLKIAADEFPKLRVLATGSSTLAASKKFRDTLTGRKRVSRTEAERKTKRKPNGVRPLFVDFLGG